MAHFLVENLRARIPYIRRLNRQIDELACRLAAVESVPELHAVQGAQKSEVHGEFRRFLRLLRPHDAAHAQKRRFGRQSDGGYVMMDDFGQCRWAVSLGVGTDDSWDTAMAARGLNVVQFDDSFDRQPENDARFKFYRARVVGRRQSPAELTLSDILALPELAAEMHLIVKIDIEGCEWEVLLETKKEEFARIRQLAIEFHGLRRFAEPAWRAIMFAALENLAATHSCVHVHGNNWGPFVVVGGIPFPDGLEATFVRKCDYTLTPSTAVFPSEHDYPCNPKFPDFYLGAWSY